MSKELAQNNHLSHGQLLVVSFKRTPSLAGGVVRISSCEASVCDVEMVLGSHGEHVRTGPGVAC